MYTHKEPIPESINQALEMYSQEDIFKIVFNEYPDYNKNYLSPFRTDKHPNCFFDWYKGKLYFRDYADIQRDCFHAVKDFFSLDSYSEVLMAIYDYFQEHKPLSKPEFLEYREKCNDVKFYDIITQIRGFELRDELFWKQYYITRQQLTDDSVYPVRKYRFYSRKQKRWITIAPFDIAYAISGFDVCKKIYRPRMRGNSKWLTNCTKNEVGNIKNISKVGRKEPYLIITKSYKDHRVIRNEGFPSTIWFQSEKQYPDDEVFFNIIKDFSKIIIFYDNDLAGITGATTVTEKIKQLISNIDVESISSPYRFFKDPASIVSNKSREALHELLWNSCHK